MAKSPRVPYRPPFETEELRNSLKAFFQTPFTDPVTREVKNIGSFKWGVYLFYDYDGEPIYVGQTNEQVSGRIGRHLTNQRTDAVAMSVLDPFEVCEIEVFPLPQFEGIETGQPSFRAAKKHLDALEYEVHRRAVGASVFSAILNEKEPETPATRIPVPHSLRGCIVSDRVRHLRSHLDVRIARRAQIIARLSQTISERQVQLGLRQTLVTQATRLQWLAQKRFAELGGPSAVETGAENEGEEPG